MMEVKVKKGEDVKEEEKGRKMMGVKGKVEGDLRKKGRVKIIPTDVFLVCLSFLFLLSAPLVCSSCLLLLSAPLVRSS